MSLPGAAVASNKKIRGLYWTHLVGRGADGEFFHRQLTCRALSFCRLIKSFREPQEHNCRDAEHSAYDIRQLYKGVQLLSSSLFSARLSVLSSLRRQPFCWMWRRNASERCLYLLDDFFCLNISWKNNHCVVRRIICFVTDREGRFSFYWKIIGHPAYHRPVIGMRLERSSQYFFHTVNSAGHCPYRILRFFHYNISFVQ